MSECHIRIFYLSISLVNEYRGAKLIRDPMVMFKRLDKDVHVRGPGTCGDEARGRCQTSIDGTDLALAINSVWVF